MSQPSKRPAASAASDSSRKQLKSSSSASPSSLSSARVAPERISLVRPSEIVTNIPSDYPVAHPGGCVVYWMSRDQRVSDNWALLFALQLARDHGVPIRVVFCLVTKFLDGTERAFSFLLQGMRKVEAELRSKQIPFHLLLGSGAQVLPEFVSAHRVSAMVCDFNPLRGPLEWRRNVAQQLDQLNPRVPLYQVDAHNVVPFSLASQKQEYGARTIRNKIHSQLRGMLQHFWPVEQTSNVKVEMPEPVNWQAADASLEIDRSVKVPALWDGKAGEQAALEQLNSFISTRLKHYATKRNDPTENAQSGLSPYLHFGHISAARCIFEVEKHRDKHRESVDAFIEELLIRRELTDNFCYYQPRYDSIDCAFPWARESLDLHRTDKRERIYSLGQLEAGTTYDELWNAAQLQLVIEGKQHGYLRMYWAKCILQWTPSPEAALAYANYLNDKYSMDGRDPNGYVGTAWSILGIHDQGWPERAVSGKIRYMNFAGCKRKFDIEKFISKFPAARVGSTGFKANVEKAKQLDQSRAANERFLDPARGVANNRLIKESKASEAGSARKESKIDQFIKRENKEEKANK